MYQVVSYNPSWIPAVLFRQAVESSFITACDAVLQTSGKYPTNINDTVRHDPSKEHGTGSISTGKAFKSLNTLPIRNRVKC